VDAGFIPLSFALEPDIAARGRFFLIPRDWHAPLEQRATVLRGAGPEARRFMEYLRQPAARAIMEKSGYTPPEQP
jgi:molybdate transport system substrate-binding protein